MTYFIVFDSLSGNNYRVFARTFPKNLFLWPTEPKSKTKQNSLQGGFPYRQCGLQQYTQNYGPHPESVTQVGRVMNQRMITI